MAERFHTQYEAPLPARTEKMPARRGWFTVETSPEKMQSLAATMAKRKDLTKIEKEFVEAIVAAQERYAMRHK